ncbi:MAG TPA: hypothetical protein DCS28_01295 [Candidatus Moranbacteria bacterium]|nr:hypothetical protein [Candidatus Moranbacteria bacterium]HAT74661.1 hypothetical protein [Candidatus Moranbacteria bacterium]
MLKKILEILIFAITLAMGFYFQWEIANFVFFILFIFLILHPIPSRFAAGSAIIFLLATAFLTVFKQNDLAETVAIWAYYLMIFTAMLSFGELRKEEEKDII